jgi:integrase
MPACQRPQKRDPWATANRTWTVLRAALNHAFAEGKVASDIAWRKVKPFKAVDTARGRYLTHTEAQRLNTSEPDFRLLVQAALLTGARYGTLTQLTVADFNPDVGTIAIRTSRKSKPYHVVLTDEGAEFFRQICAGRAGDYVMLRRADGAAWGTSHQLRPIKFTTSQFPLPASHMGLTRRHEWSTAHSSRKKPWPRGYGNGRKTLRSSSRELRYRRNP